MLLLVEDGCLRQGLRHGLWHGLGLLQGWGKSGRRTGVGGVTVLTQRRFQRHGLGLRWQCESERSGFNGFGGFTNSQLVDEQLLEEEDEQERLRGRRHPQPLRRPLLLYFSMRVAASLMSIRSASST